MFSYFKSKTIRFGAVMTALYIAAPELLTLFREMLPEAASFLPDNIYQLLNAATLVGLFYYRAKTVTPLADYKHKEQK